MTRFPDFVPIDGEIEGEAEADGPMDGERDGDSELEGEILDERDGLNTLPTINAEIIAIRIKTTKYTVWFFMLKTLYHMNSKYPTSEKLNL